MTTEMMTGNFIGVFPNLVDKKVCQDIIDNFELLDSKGLTRSRQQIDQVNTHHKDDKALFTDTFITAFKKESTDPVIQGLNNSIQTYCQKFSCILNDSDVGVYDTKVQRTIPTGGYHVWHHEHAPKDCMRRVLAYILYLNDVEEGGETEFLYLSKRIKPEAGTLIIFPSAFTHAHRGNPPLSGTKYIITGWGELA